MKNFTAFQKLLFPLVIVLTILSITLTSIRFLITPLYPKMEYSFPNFPSDSYGFTQQERMILGTSAIQYLFNDQPVEWLNTSQQTNFPQESPLYNQRELAHMQDVKVLVTQARTLWLISLLLFVIIFLSMWQKQTLSIWLQMVSWGGFVTILLMVVLGITIALGFESLFTQFHHLFFEGNTWLFYTSDTLIRLFPLRFWRDGFIVGSLLIFIGALFAWQISSIVRFNHQKTNKKHK